MLYFHFIDLHWKLISLTIKNTKIKKINISRWSICFLKSCIYNPPKRQDLSKRILNYSLYLLQNYSNLRYAKQVSTFYCWTEINPFELSDYAFALFPMYALYVYKPVTATTAKSSKSKINHKYTNTSKLISAHGW